MMRFPRKDRESGSSLLIVLVVMILFMLSMSTVFRNVKMSSKGADKVSDEIDQANTSRFVNQVISDDQLCGLTDFLDGIDMDKVSFVKPSEDITLKDNGALVDYTALSEPDKKSWPGDMGTRSGSVTTDKGEVIVGNFKHMSVTFVQAKNREVLKTKHVNKTSGKAMDYIRIPVNVRDRGIINGRDVTLAGGIYTYIELKPVPSGDPPVRDPPVACYKDVSSRSLCLDIGGRFDVNRPDKCVRN